MKKTNTAITQVTGKPILLSLITSLAIIGVMPQAHAASFDIRPINFISGPGYSMTATGTISTAGNTSSISGWNLTVTTTERLAHYTPANTSNMSAGSVTSDGHNLSVATSPDGFQDGGSLFFRASNPFLDFGVSVADFTGPNLTGGQAMYMAGAAFDFLGLNQPDNSTYVTAQSNGSSGNLFDLLPISFSNGVTLSGTIRTDGTTGLLDPNDIVSWDVYVDQMTRDVFDPANSILHASQVALNPNGLDLTVNNPDGYLMFSKGSSGGHLYALQLADFSDQSPLGGQAGYFQGLLAATTLDLNARGGPWTVTGTDPISQPVTEPTTILLLCTGLVGLATTRLRKKKP